MNNLVPFRTRSKAEYAGLSVGGQRQQENGGAFPSRKSHQLMVSAKVADMRMQRQRCLVGMVVATVVPTIEKAEAGR